MKALWLGLGLGFATGGVWVALGLWGLRILLERPASLLQTALQHTSLHLLVAPFALQVVGVGGLLGVGVGVAWDAWGRGGWNAHLIAALGVAGALALPALPVAWLLRPAWGVALMGWLVGVLLLGILLPALA
ncbi:hypothetical protein HRbin23_00508 [bacterium HR23]|nr:hypothetical protein HRbin23_00508 [bacterium HR23]